MKTNNPHGDDAPLDALLKEWNPKPSLPPRFQEQVWRRIERAEPARVPTVTLAQFFAEWLATKLPRPALATAYVAVLLVIGAGVGWSQARQETERVSTELGARYAQAVDPYQTTP
jgi:hypothetical protein